MARAAAPGGRRGRPRRPGHDDDLPVADDSVVAPAWGRPGSGAACGSRPARQRRPDRAWRAHLTYNLDALSSRDPLLHDGVYAREDRDRLRLLIEQLMLVEFDHGVAHGDLAPRNLVPRHPPLPPLLLDWGTTTTGPVPWTDLQRVFAWARYDRTVDERALAQFAAAAGVPLDSHTAAILEQKSAVRFLDLARWTREHRPDLYRDQCRTSRRGLLTILSRR